MLLTESKQTAESGERALLRMNGSRAPALEASGFPHCRSRSNPFQESFPESVEIQVPSDSRTDYCAHGTGLPEVLRWLSQHGRELPETSVRDSVRDSPTVQGLSARGRLGQVASPAYDAVMSNDQGL
jgi:hypothetical protein